MQVSTHISYRLLPHLPAETWNQILALSSRKTHIVFLSVSSFLHSIALRFVFRVIKIYFLSSSNPSLFESLYITGDEENTFSVCSWEILDRICNDRVFAAVVRRLVVNAFSKERLAFETGSLAKALHYLPHLGSFHWQGIAPALPAEIAQSLSTDCKHLGELVLHTDYTAAAPKLSHLSSLTLLTLTIHLPSIYDEYSVWDHLAPALSTSNLVSSLTDPRSLEDLALTSAFIALMSSLSLKRLSIPGHCLTSLPIHCFSNLSHLELRVPRGGELDGFELMLHHASHIEDLVIAGFIGDHIYELLAQNANAGTLPLLKSFQVMHIEVDDRVSKNHIYLLIAFLLPHAHRLERLSLMTNALWMDALFNLHGLVELLKQCTVLRAFGFRPSCHDEEGSTNWAAVYNAAMELPPSIEALHFGLELSVTENVEQRHLDDFLSALEIRPNLTFLHIHDINACLSLDAGDMVSYLVNLEIIGLERRLWYINRISPSLEVGDDMRDDSAVSEVGLSMWWVKKVRFGVREDYGLGTAGEDREWLMRLI